MAISVSLLFKLVFPKEVHFFPIILFQKLNGHGYLTFITLPKEVLGDSKIEGQCNSITNNVRKNRGAWIWDQIMSLLRLLGMMKFVWMTMLLTSWRTRATRFLSSRREGEERRWAILWRHKDSKEIWRCTVIVGLCRCSVKEGTGCLYSNLKEEVELGSLLPLLMRSHDPLI